ncbi:MAG: type II 3-dehydroquinate dehydratase [Gemmatimonadales bacterium]|nr:MAG: type II 3-dehydroquinate dehydratase [Gemmatimonadales bacterium]
MGAGCHPDRSAGPGNGPDRVARARRRLRTPGPRGARIGLPKPRRPGRGRGWRGWARRFSGLAPGTPIVRVGVIHGPNLGLLGRREPETYGRRSLEEINAALEEVAAELGAELEILQTNHEGEILDWIETMGNRVDGFLVNPAALTHTSVALRDGLLAVDRPFVEVHLSNPKAREPFRHHSYLADVAHGVVFGFGSESYLLGLRGLCAHLHG